MDLGVVDQIFDASQSQIVLRLVVFDDSQIAQA